MSTDIHPARQRTRSLAGHGGYAIGLRTWEPPGVPRAVVQIAHGMGEHSARYAELAAALCAAGIAVYANDHRGHGLTVPEGGTFGEFGAGGFEAVVADMAAVTDLIRHERPGLPVVLLAHSMGSFAAQLYMLDHARAIAGLVLSGTAALDQRRAAQLKAKDNWTLESNNAQFAPGRTPFDWLTRDADIVDAYIADPLCGFTVTPSSLSSMHSAYARACLREELSRVRPDLPVLLISGDMDPVNGNLLWLHPLVERLRAAGLRDVSVRIYPGGRHEVLNETNRATVFADLIEWIDRACSALTGGSGAAATSSRRFRRGV